MKTITFNGEQQKYLVAKLGGELAAGLIAVAAVGAHGSMRALVEPKLDAGDWAMIESLAVEAKAAGFPGTPGTPGAAVPSIQGLHAAAVRLADLLSQRNRAGEIFRKHAGIAREYLDGKFSWPTVDAFGRPFPAPESIAAMKKVDASTYVTSSGFPKCKLDGVMYMQHRNDDQTGVLGPVKIEAGSWRGYNQQGGTLARYWAPSYHAQCPSVLLTGQPPAEYLALQAKAPAASAPQPGLPAAAPKRTRKATVAK